MSKQIQRDNGCPHAAGGQCCGKHHQIIEGEIMTTWQKSMQKLKDGNMNFVAGTPSQKDFVAQRAALVNGQKPHSIIVACSDSRVPPEHIFDSGLGEIFIIRNAGNNPATKYDLGSIEYAAEHLHTPLLVILGHSSCGAINATCAGGHAEGNIAEIVKTLMPAVEKAGKDPAKAVEINVHDIIKNVREKSGIVRELEEKGELKVVGAIYDLGSGAVRFL
ncbi:MAG: carbonic anhydrase [Candidatus Micrarchaeia archaeon]